MSNPSSTTKVSFTVRRPTPVSRDSSTGADSDSSFKVPGLPRHLRSEEALGSPLARSATASPRARTYAERDSSEEEEEDQDELVTGFDRFGVQRVHEKKKPQGPLVIPALQNKDWRELARKRKQIYVPPSAAATTGADGSVGGLGTRDTINSGPQLAGLQLSKRPKLEETTEVSIKAEERTTTTVTTTSITADGEVKKEEEETEDQKAIRAILAAAQNPYQTDERQIDIITPVTEEDALHQDLEELPESATLEDYERVPVSQFGAALLRGMGWKDGTAASKRAGPDGKAKGLVEPWLPQARPALLGIGAKEKEVFDDGSRKAGKKLRPERKYMPLLKVERRSGETSRQASEDRESRSGSSSRRRSPSPRRSSRRSPSPGRRGDGDRDRYEPDYDRRRDRDDRRERRRDYDASSSRRDGDRDRERDRRRERSPDRSGDTTGRRRDKDGRDY